MKNSQGFSLIEVLVTIVLTTVGILGMVALQSKSIQYTQDAVSRNAAVTLSNDFIEIMRAHKDDLFNKVPPLDYSYTELKLSSSIYDAEGSFEVSDAACPTSGFAQTLDEEVGCWLKQVQETLPDASSLLEDYFMVCPSYKVESTGKPICASANYKGSTLAIQLAWRSKEAVCGEESNSDVCTFTTRVEL